jgi:hypothetical protein
LIRELSDNAFDRAGAIFACDCIETCNELSYDYELSQTPIASADMIRWRLTATARESCLLLFVRISAL